MTIAPTSNPAKYADLQRTRGSDGLSAFNCAISDSNTGTRANCFVFKLVLTQARLELANPQFF